MGAVTFVPPLTLHTVRLSRGGRTLLSDLSGTFQPGSLTALIGPNGSGKTTLPRAIARLHPLDAGRIDGAGPRTVALLPQGSQLDRCFPITCRQVVTLAAPSLGWLRAAGKAQRDAAEAALVRVGLAGLEDRPVQ